MRLFRGQLLIFFIIYVRDSSCVIDDLYGIGKKVWKLYSTLDKSNLTSPFESNTAVELIGYDYTENKKIKDQMYEIHVQLREIEKSINPRIIQDLTKILSLNALLVRCIDVMGTFLMEIDDDYEKFYQIISQNSNIFDRSFVNSPTSIFLNIESNIGMIRKIMTEPDDLLPEERDFITAVSGYAMIRYQEICDSSQPIPEILVNLFKIAIIAEIKTSLMLTWANVHRYAENQEWKIMNIPARRHFQEYFESYVSIMQRNLDITTGLYIRACDPENSAWILDENYYELDGMIQAIIFQYQPTVCAFQSCHNMWQKRATRCDARYYDERSSCSNTPTECENLGTVQACVLKNGPHKFQYVNSTVLGFLGSNSQCPEDNGRIIDIGKLSDSAYAACACNCNRNHNKISLSLMESRVKSNMVITGLRLTRKNNILYIQPREGKLMANGYINRHSEKWLSIPNDIETSQIHDINRENSIFFLDDVFLPSNFILTGVKFNKVTRGTVTGFAIEIFGVLFDYRNGQLDLGRRVGLSSSSEDPRQSMIFERMSPLQTKLPNRPSSSSLKYIELKRSLLENDFGQSTLPLFDAVPITTDPPSALGGIGIFHKGVEGYAGFISLKAYGIKYTGYFENFTSAHTIEGQMQLFT